MKYRRLFKTCHSDFAKKILSQVLLVGGCIFYGAFSQAEGNLENPAKDSIESGITAISGWHCTAQEIEIEIDGISFGKAGIATSRVDTESRCGHSETGFSLLFNYGNLAEGTHTLIAKVDGEVWLEREFSSIRPGGDGVEFISDVEHVEYAIDFPKAGDVLELHWQQSKQSFSVNKSYRNLVNPSKMVSSFNRTFFGHARGFDPARPERRFGELDSTEFSFNITETTFTMSREGTDLGSCDYNGDIEFFYNRVTSEGTFNCGGSSGDYSAEMFVNSNEGYYIGRFDVTPVGSEQSTRDFHMALAP